MTLLFTTLLLVALVKLLQAFFDDHPKVPDTPASLMTS